MGAFTRFFGKSPRVHVLEAFAENDEDELSVPDIVRATGVSKRAAYMHVRSLLKEGVLMKSSKKGKATFYKFNEQDPRGTALTFLENVLVLGRLERQIRIDEGIPLESPFPYRWFYKREIKVEPQVQFSWSVATVQAANVLSFSPKLTIESGPSRGKGTLPFSAETISDTPWAEIQDYSNIASAGS